MLANIVCTPQGIGNNVLGKLKLYGTVIRIQRTPALLWPRKGITVRKTQCYFVELQQLLRKSVKCSDYSYFPLKKCNRKYMCVYYGRFLSYSAVLGGINSTLNHYCYLLNSHPLLPSATWLPLPPCY